MHFIIIIIMGETLNNVVFLYVMCLQPGFPGFNFGGDGGFQMSFGIGAFPFGIFASSMNMNDGRPRPR